MADSNPTGLCQCGCGQPAPIAPKTCSRTGARKGQPQRFIQNHHMKHGYSRSRTYYSWRAMISRCETPSFRDYQRYGARGIKVCDRWHDLMNFIADMGERLLGKTLDRYPNGSGNYEPGNCRWATLKEQAKNRRSTRYISAFGKTKSTQEWANETSLDRGIIENRLLRGWSVERALSTKPLARGSWNANKTHCKYGHLLSGGNVRPNPNNPRHRICRACARAASLIAGRKKRQDKKVN